MLLASSIRNDNKGDTMKLNKEILDRGRALVLNKELDAFKQWHNENIPAWHHIDPRESFQKAYDLGMDGTKLFDRLYSNVDPNAESVKLIISAVKNLLLVLFLLLIVFGSIGGVVYLLG